MLVLLLLLWYRAPRRLPGRSRRTWAAVGLEAGTSTVWMRSL